MGTKRFLALMLGVLAAMWTVAALRALDEKETKHLASFLDVKLVDRVDANTTRDEMVSLVGRPTIWLNRYHPDNPQSKCEYCWWENERQQVIMMAFMDGKLLRINAMGFPGGYKEKRTSTVQCARP